IVAGATGSGKTTQLPKMCLEAGLGIGGLIGHTQPRRIAARTVAMRIADELQTPLGKAVGFQVRFSDTTSEDNYIKIMTDGILLSETQENRWLNQYDCLIIDEAHERSLNIDFLLGYLKKLITKRKNIKVIITSATIDIERFSTFFNDAPIIEIPGKTYPVLVQYMGDDFPKVSDDPIMQVVQAVELACQHGPGDILIFQSGEKEIRDVIEMLSSQHLKNVELLPLYSRQSNAEQQKVFQRASKRKIIVTTNVAETSLTVPNIRYVIDSGLARISRYNYRNKLQRLPIEAISQASADQRMGRCGRVGPGICYRLYSKEDYQSRPLYTEPEILRTNLAAVILKMLSLNFDSIETFPFVEAPDSRFIKDGFTLLERLEAVDAHNNITQLGRTLATIPIEPKLGRVIIAANQYGALQELLIIVSALSIVDVRERPKDFQADADMAHAKFAHESSDFMSMVNLWHFIMEHKKQLSHQKMRKLCQQNFLSFLRVLEWIEVHEQLTQIVKEHNYKINQVPADYSLIHKALLCGFIDGIGIKDEKKEYHGARNIKFNIHPQSVLFKKSPNWIFSSEIVHTTKTFARVNAQIETSWIEEVAETLIKKQYDEPYFEPKRGQVLAFERGTLFGLEIYAKKKISYEKVAPVGARHIFIEQALVQEGMISHLDFYKHNKALRIKIENVENRIRKQLILLDEAKIKEFYEAKLPFYVCSVQSLEKYLKDKPHSFLYLNERDILLNEITNELLELYPAKLKIKDQSFELSYIFDPSQETDGVTLIVPFEMLKYIKDEDFSWVIPGLLEEKIDFLIRALPKKYRILFVPIPEVAKKAKFSLSSTEGTLQKALQHYLETHSKNSIDKNSWENVIFPAHLLMHFQVIKEGKVLAQGDDINQLYQSLQEQYLEIYSSTAPIERENITQWDFDDLPNEYKVKRGNLDFICYPALVDMGQSVSIKLFDEHKQAHNYHRLGLARLYLLTLHDACKNIKRNILAQTKKSLVKHYTPFGSYDELMDHLLLACALNLFIDERPPIFSKKEFNENLTRSHAQFVLVANQTIQLIEKIFTQYQEVQACLQRKNNSEDPQAVLDMKGQLESLFPKNFILQTPLLWLRRFPVYLKAIELRMEKLQRQLAKDKQARVEIDAVRKVYLSKFSSKDKQSLSVLDPLNIFQWKMEELRVSLFAQELKTIEPVSKVRLLKILENID
ncbi:MAG: ATP-dependent RNA helicase HrpA, partial [Proteobacteria bacterium]|nr:ATP-dependent RNA helicase HrpA [Pseudomonadota bacterium]